MFLFYIFLATIFSINVLHYEGETFIDLCPSISIYNKFLRKECHVRFSDSYYLSKVDIVY